MGLQEREALAPRGADKSTHSRPDSVRLLRRSRCAQWPSPHLLGRRCQCLLNCSPPPFAAMRLVEIHPLAHPWSRQLNAVGDRQRGDTFERFVPAMHREIECAVMNWDQRTTSQINMGLDCLLRLHMHVWPLRVVRSGLDECHIERSEALADHSEAVEVPGVATKEHAQFVVNDDPRRPQRAIAVKQAAPRKCWAGVAVSVRPATSTLCHQSSWRTFPASMPHSIRRSPTPSVVTKTLVVSASAHTASRSR